MISPVEEMDNELAAVVPQLALALWIWDAAGLEPGERAIYTSGSLADRWIGTVAGWRSMRDVVRLDDSRDEWRSRPGVINHPINDPEETVRWLAKEACNTPGVAAAVLSSEPLLVDVLLEALPVWARIVLAMPSSAPMTIDFYTNVHRKGTRIVSVPASPDEFGEPGWQDAASIHIARAKRILESPNLARVCTT